MTAKYTRVTVASTRSPRSSWNQPRSLHDVLTVLELNGFLRAQSDTGVSLVRVCGQLAIKVTIVDRRALLETALRAEGGSLRWRASSELHKIGSAPWQVAREALELLATIDVDTPVRWG